MLEAADLYQPVVIETTAFLRLGVIAVHLE